MNPSDLRYETRARAELKDELVRRGRLWLPEWRPGGLGSDLAEAIFKIAARLESEVTQRLNRVPEKVFRGFLYWLGARGSPGNAARLPIALKMAAGADPVLADAPVQIQADAGGTPVIFETSEPLQVTPANLVAVIGAELPDVFKMGPVSSYEAPQPLPDEWRMATDAPAGATDLQLDPPVGLAAGTVLVDAAQRHYRVIAAKDGLVTIDPGLAAPDGESAMPDDQGATPMLRRARNFDPFGADRNQQEHALYVGSTTALDITFPATIEVRGVGTVAAAAWSYWGTAGQSTKLAWQPLDAKPSDDGVRLVGVLGKFEMNTLGGFRSRWLRATPQGEPSAALSASAISLRINCGSDPVAPTTSTIEGIANTAPLVLSRGFYPMGREPRLFDAFYLGCNEALSKTGADVTLTVSIGSGFSGPLAGLFLTQAFFAVGIGNDGKLNRVEAARLPGAMPILPPSVQPIDAEGRAVQLTPGARPGVASMGASGFIGVPAGGDVWLWTTSDVLGGPGSWQALGAPASDGAAVADTVLVRTGNGRDVFVYAVAAGRLYRRIAPSNGPWETVRVADGAGGEAKVARVVPIVRAEAQPGEVDVADGLAVTDVRGRLFVRTGNMPGFLPQGKDVDPRSYPLVVSTPQGAARRTYVFAAGPQDGTVIAYDLYGTAPAKTIAVSLVGRYFGFLRTGANLVAAAFVTQSGADRRLALWEPFGADTLAFDGPDAGLHGAPVAFAGGILIPMEKGAVGFGHVDPTLVAKIVGPQVGFAAILESGARWIGLDKLLVDATRLNRLFKVSAVSGLTAGAVALQMVAGRDSDVPEPVDIYRSKHDDRQGIVLARDQVQLEAGDTAQAGDLLYLAWSARDYRFIPIDTVKTVAPSTSPVAVLRTRLPAGVAAVTYRNVDPAVGDTGILRPTVTAPSLPGAFFNVPQSVHLEVGDSRLRVLDDAPNDSLFVLDERWEGSQHPPEMTAVAAFSLWTAFQPPRPTNPELSWEYWNGASWWSIEGVRDGTANLVATGAVTFRVPPNLQPTDVVGRTNRWIRARLVGGDYGQEEVWIEKVPPSSQKVVRDTSKIRAPYVTGLTVNYKVCCPVAPEWVLTQDSGGILDQTAASQTPNASVKVFTPLSEALKAAASVTTGEIADDSSAKSMPTVTPAAVDDCTVLSDQPPAAATGDSGPGRAIYLGFDRSLQGTGISLLFMLEDKQFEGAFPLTVEAYADGAFSPVGCDDGTRGLGETGILTVSLPQALQQALFFGSALFWLRLSPNPRLVDVTTWSPQIRDVYLNAAWVTAAETQTNELLGSSDGSPGQAVILARPPVVEDSLRLRVREPLGDEEIAELRAADPAAVLDSLGPWAGPWVLWRLGGIDGAGPLDRVYDFDASTGTVGFGDGVQGRIPPVGRDNIAAERYRAGGGAAANAVRAWSQLNLVTPVQGVEITIAPDGAAGGADPQDAAAMLRFGPAQLAMRDRAVTLHDFEQLAFRSSAKIGQVRAIAAGRSVRVIIVIRGREPLPSVADIREVKAFLLERAAPALAASGVLRVEAPELVPVIVTVAATVPDLSLGANVAQAVVERVQDLLDPATGGFDGMGWRLGDMLTETDVAAVLDGMPHLEDFDVIISPAAGATVPLRPNQLLVLAENGVRVACRSGAAEGVG